MDRQSVRSFLRHAPPRNLRPSGRRGCQPRSGSRSTIPPGNRLSSSSVSGSASDSSSDRRRSVIPPSSAARARNSPTSAPTSAPVAPPVLAAERLINPPTPAPTAAPIAAYCARVTELRGESLALQRGDEADMICHKPRDTDWL